MKQKKNIKWRSGIVALYSLLPLTGFSQADSFFVAGIHPAAILQSSNVGKQLLTLFPWNEKLYAGYGDYGANTGLIDIYAFSPDSLAFIYEGQANYIHVMGRRKRPFIYVYLWVNIAPIGHPLSHSGSEIHCSSAYCTGILFFSYPFIIGKEC